MRQGSGPTAPQAAPAWIEERYQWTMNEPPGEVMCLAGQRFHPLIRCSPSGDWELHPKNDYEGSICLVNRELGVHRVLFTCTEAVPKPEGEYIRIIHRRPSDYFWAGDESGVFLRYYDPEEGPAEFFYVSVPEGKVTRLDLPIFFHSDGWTRQVSVLGSPLGTRDLVIKEKLGEYTDLPVRHRLCVFDMHGREKLCLDEIEGPGVFAESTHRVVMIVSGGQRLSDTSGWGSLYSEVRVYRIEPDGTWSRSVYEGVAAPALRGDCLTMVEKREERPWVKQVSPEGEGEYLFPVPEELLGVGGGALVDWDDTGRCAFFPFEVLVRLDHQPATR